MNTEQTSKNIFMYILFSIQVVFFRREAYDLITCESF